MFLHVGDSYEYLIQAVCGQLYGSCTKFPLENSNLCSSLPCPVQSGAQYVVRLSVLIKSYWPDVSTAITVFYNIVHAL